MHHMPSSAAAYCLATENESKRGEQWVCHLDWTPAHCVMSAGGPFAVSWILTQSMPAPRLTQNSMLPYLGCMGYRMCSAETI